MKILKNRNQAFFLILVLGFFVGILLENFLFAESDAGMVLFQEFFLQNFSKSDLKANDFLVYIFIQRVKTFVIVLLLGNLKWKKSVAGCCLAYVGMLFGAISVQSVVWLGMKGIILCVLALFPHSIFYGMAYWIYFYYLVEEGRRRWTVEKTTFVVVMMLMGMLLEAYVCPFFIKIYLRFL